MCVCVFVCVDELTWGTVSCPVPFSSILILAPVPFLKVLFIPIAIKEVFSLWHNDWLMSSTLTDIDCDKLHYNTIQIGPFPLGCFPTKLLTYVCSINFCVEPP